MPAQALGCSDQLVCFTAGADGRGDCSLNSTLPLPKSCLVLPESHETRLLFQCLARQWHLSIHLHVDRGCEYRDGIALAWLRGRAFTTTSMSETSPNDSKYEYRTITARAILPFRCTQPSIKHLTIWITYYLRVPDRCLA